MKKMLVLVLAVIMVMSMAVPAAALNSPTATAADLTPVLTKESTLIVELHTTADVLKLAEEVQEVMAEAKEDLQEAAPKGFAVKYFFYVEIIGTEKSVAVEFEPIKGITAETDAARLVVMQFVNGKWVELEFTINADGTITVLGVVEGPIAVFMK